MMEAYRTQEAAMDAPYRFGSRLAGKRVVTLGGGTGPFAVLSNLKKYSFAVTAVVSMADSGGSSRRLMDEFGQLPFGDLRQALVALARHGVLWREIFNFRFPTTGNGNNGHGEVGEGVGGVGGHSLGNLIISALQEINGGDLLLALQDAQELLETSGAVLPVTTEHTMLCADLEDGTTICGETNIDTRGMSDADTLPAIKRIFLDKTTPACKEAIRALRRADVIIIGPGDLYTSILPNLLVEDVARTIRESEAEKVYVCNLMTKHGETDGFQASDFVREIHRYLGGRVDRVILHDGSFPEHLKELYAEQQQHTVTPDIEQLKKLVPEVTVDQLIAIRTDHYVRHDPERLVRAVLMSSGNELPPNRWQLES
jgi:uncharacterized cofD-like protein